MYTTKAVAIVKLRFDEAKWMMTMDGTWLMLKVDRTSEATAACDFINHAKAGNYYAGNKETVVEN